MLQQSQCHPWHVLVEASLLPLCDSRGGCHGVSCPHGVMCNSPLKQCNCCLWMLPETVTMPPEACHCRSMPHAFGWCQRWMPQCVHLQLHLLLIILIVHVLVVFFLRLIPLQPIPLSFLLVIPVSRGAPIWIDSILTCRCPQRHGKSQWSLTMTCLIINIQIIGQSVGGCLHPIPFLELASPSLRSSWAPSCWGFWTHNWLQTNTRRIAGLPPCNLRDLRTRVPSLSYCDMEHWETHLG